MKAAAKKVLKPNIYQHHDYRLFLKEWFEYLRDHKGLSQRKLAVFSGLAAGYLPMVLSGKRSLTEKALKALEPYLELDGKTFQFLFHLRELGEAEKQEDLFAAYEKIKKNIHYKELHQEDIEAHRLLTAWYYTAIREMAHFKEFKLEPKWIRKQLKNKVPLKEIEKAVQFLLDSKFLVMEKNGRVSIPDKGISCDGGVYRLAIGEFHSQMLNLATTSIHNTPREKRNLTTHTMAISRNQVDELNEILTEAIEKIQALGDQTKNAEEVYQVSLLSFPLTERDDQESGDE